MNSLQGLLGIDEKSLDSLLGVVKSTLEELLGVNQTANSTPMGFVAPKTAPTRKNS